MEAVFICHNQNTFKYRNYPKGHEFIGTYKTEEEANEAILKREELFDQPDGTYKDEMGREVYDPKWPRFFTFGDYYYHIKTVNLIDPNDQPDMVAAILKADPYNVEQIKVEMGMKSKACEHAINLLDQGVQFQEAVAQTLDTFEGVYRSDLEKELEHQYKP